MDQGFLLGELTILAITGADRLKIANNLCTQDLKSIAPGQIAETFVTDVKGRTLSHGVALAREDALWFISSPGQGTRLVPHFDRYIIREDAAVQDASGDWDAVLFLAIEDALAFGASHPDWGCVITSVPWVSGGGLVLVPAGRRDQLTNDVREGSIAPSDTRTRSVWERARIEAFWPWYGVDLDDRNLPQEAGIDARAISFKKGCYLGQETVARLDALGQVQKRLVRLTFERKPEVSLPHSIEVDGKEIGTLTSFAEMEDGSGMGLAMIRRSHFASGTQFDISGQRGLVI
jgi:folate-binding protein YgfZ